MKKECFYRGNGVLPLFTDSKVRQGWVKPTAPSRRIIFHATSAWSLPAYQPM